MEKRIEFVAIFKSPVLSHNPASMQKPTGTGGRTGSNIPTPEKEAADSCYKDDDGHYCLPGIAFRNSFIAAASGWKGSWQKKRETLKAMVAHCVVEPELVPLLDAKTMKPMKAYKIDTRRAVVQKQGIQRSRARFEGAAAKFTLVYEDTYLRADERELRNLFVNVLNDAGNRIGVGDYRPAKTGWFGRFVIGK